MSCAFDLAHYREIVEAAQAGGYRFAHFDGAPADGSVILRHDVDLSLDAAVRMAELENDAGASATYFLMTESVFYNLDSSEGVAAIERLRELGHRVALHAVYPNAPRGRALRSRSSPGTTPIPSTCARRFPTGGST